MSTDIALCQDGITQWLNIPNTLVQEVLTFPSRTDLLVKRAPSLLNCSQCGQLCFYRDDRTTQHIRDLNILERHTYLVLDKWRVLCPTYGVHVENLGFAAPYSRYTLRFEDLVACLCDPLAIGGTEDHVHILVRLHPTIAVAN